jgi:hypothetical protein
MKALSRSIFFSVIAALPLGGLLLFFEITRPAEIAAGSFVATQLSPASSDTASLASVPGRRFAVTRFKGVSAELSPVRLPLPAAPVFSASDAERVFAASPASLEVGFQSDFVTREGRRAGLRIVARDPILDQAITDSERLMAITPVSTARLVSFVWGAWLYQAELTDKGAATEAETDQKVVVQKVL